MDFLHLDKNSKAIGYYHKSSKLLIPLSICSLITYNLNISPCDAVIAVPTVLNYSYHSYVSCSTIITDYIKPTHYSVVARLFNLKTHTLGTMGFFYYLYKTNKNLLR
jgi:succinate dehydrogenase hydrophobic anchor subunit